jgi:hypothetical protein
LNAPAGAGNGSLFWVGSGFWDNGDAYTGNSAGYRWTGSAWSNTGYPSNVGTVAMTRVNTTTTNGIYGAGGADNTGGYTSATYSLTSPSTWLLRNSGMPFAQSGYGLIALNSSGNIRQGGGFTRQNQATYYITSVTSGNWTSTGVNNPSNLQRTGAVDNNFNGEGFFFGATGTNNYKVTSSTSAFTGVTNSPWGTSDTAPFGSVIGGLMIIFPNKNLNVTPYRFDGSTYTAQTSFPVNGYNMAGGESAANVYRLVNTLQTNHHYFATMS